MTNKRNRIPIVIVGKQGDYHTALIPNAQNYIEEKMTGVFRS